MSSQPRIERVERDERTLAVENAGYRWAYLVVSYGLLVVVAYRSFALQESPWDLLGLVIVGGAVGTVYQGYHRVLSRGWASAVLLAVAVAAFLAFALVGLR